MRDISTLTIDEVCEFLDVSEGEGGYEIKKFKYIKSRETFEVLVLTTWETKDEDEKEVEYDMEDIWYFKQDEYDSDDDSVVIKPQLYNEFLIAKGFKDSSFKLALEYLK